MNHSTAGAAAWYWIATGISLMMATVRSIFLLNQKDAVNIPNSGISMFRHTKQWIDTGISVVEGGDPGAGQGILCCCRGGRPRCWIRIPVLLWMCTKCTFSPRNHVFQDLGIQDSRIRDPRPKIPGSWDPQSLFRD